jgi:imidazolonepropionase-like amidohydrolase
MSAALVGLAAVVAIVGGKVMPGDGPAIEGGTVILRDGKIAAVGKGLAVPAGAQVIDATGKVVTPGLVDAMTALGLVEISGVSASNDTSAGGDLIQAAQRAVDSFNPRSPVIAIQRAHGVTTVVAAQRGGLVSGQAFAFTLDGTVIQPSVAMVAHARIGGGHRGRALLKLRELLDDTRTYAKKKKDFDRRALRDLTASRLDLEAMLPVVKGTLPLTLNPTRASDIEAALRFAADEKIQLILWNPLEAWVVAEALAKAQVGVVLDVSANLPSSLDAVKARADAIVRLHAAGVPVAISTFSAHNVRKLRQWAGNAVREGLPHEAALAAVTSVPAALYGLKDRGALRPGLAADVVVWSGDPFELSTRVEALYIAGEALSTGHRQRALFDRFRSVPPAY